MSYKTFFHELSSINVEVPSHMHTDTCTLTHAHSHAHSHMHTHITYHVHATEAFTRQNICIVDENTL